MILYFKSQNLVLYENSKSIGGGIHASRSTFSGMVIKEVVFSYEHENAIM